MKYSDSTGKISAALSNFQGDLTAILKDGQARNSRYVSLDAILETIYPLLKTHRISVAQSPENDASLANVCITTRLTHESGEYMESSLHMPLVEMISKEGKKIINDAQKIGAAITYGRRYALAAMLGIAQTDDDAESLEQKPVARPIKQYEQKSPPPNYSQGNTTLVDEEIGQELAMELHGLIKDAKWELEDIKKYFREKFGADNVPDNFINLKKSMFNKMASAAHKRIADNKKAEKAK